jgi:aldose 1-epimerase
MMDEQNNAASTEQVGSNDGVYTAEVYFDHELESTILLLAYKDKTDPARSITIGVAPDLGSNMFRFRVGDHDLIYCEPDLLKRKDFTGNFVLWPFPNRMRDKRYVYRGQAYSLEEFRSPQGNAVLIHGLVFDQRWQYERPVANLHSARVTTFIDITPESPFYQGYPFESRLSLTYTLTHNGVTISYRVQNNGTKDMPFGFALHPYFATLSGKDETLVSLPATTVMEADDELLPTGRLLNVESIMYAMFDLRQPVPVANLKLDHVYTKLYDNEQATIIYTKQAMRLRISTSDEFKYIVIYTPPQEDEPFLCLEHQTCSTDAVNLHNRGMEELASLLEVSPQESATGFLQYTVEYEA